MGGDQTSNIYFAYGSNLSLQQMRNRCPGAMYYGFGRLNGYKWLINERGYANVIEINSTTESNKQDHVEGMLYNLTPEDEKRLDAAEGVPFVYEKHSLKIQLIERNGEVEQGKMNSGPSQVSNSVSALVYVDVERKVEGKIREEYVKRMNRGIQDALTKGMSISYVNSVLRNWIPAEEGHEQGTDVVDPFLWQARGEERD